MKLSVMPFLYLILFPIPSCLRKYQKQWWKCLCWTNNSLLLIFLLSLVLVLWLNLKNYEILGLCKYIFNSWAFLVAKIVISTCSARDLGSIPGLGRFPWRRKWQPTPVLFPGEFRAQRSLRATVRGVAKSQTQLSD